MATKTKPMARKKPIKAIKISTEGKPMPTKKRKKKLLGVEVKVKKKI